MAKKLMKMNRIAELSKQIEILHPIAVNINVEIEDEDALRILIERYVNCSEEKLKAEMIIINQDELAKIFAYIPSNFYDVDLTNLYKIYIEKSNENWSKVIYRAWQNSYFDIKSKKVMSDIAVNDKWFKKLLLDNHWGQATYNNILDSEDAIHKMIELIRSHKSKGVDDFREEMNYWGIIPGTALYNDCETLYYTFCSKKGYESAGIDSLKNVINKMKAMHLKEFVVNFVNMFSLEELEHYFELIDKLIANTGANRSEKFIDFFRNVDSEIVKKYSRLVNRYHLHKNFNTSDERYIFWKQFDFIKMDERYTYNKALIMEADDFYISEFVDTTNNYNGEPTYGCIYVYTKEVFDKSVRRLFRRYNYSKSDAVELKRILRDDYNRMQNYSIYMKEHRGFWQYEVEKFLRNNDIVEKI